MRGISVLYAVSASAHWVTSGAGKRTNHAGKKKTGSSLNSNDLVSGRTREAEKHTPSQSQMASDWKSSKWLSTQSFRMRGICFLYAVSASAHWVTLGGNLASKRASNAGKKKKNRLQYHQMTWP
ncbi:hypothetical protein B0H11DRAFT_1932656 [Mycena galericulata]|nr:hypothetical protein B0H11DRAFT_1932656 [Mycena galericulata]